MRRKFEIRYPLDYVEESLGGKPYKPKGKMLVMNSQGVFFQVDLEDYYTSVTKLSNILYKFDVVWRN